MGWPSIEGKEVDRYHLEDLSEKERSREINVYTAYRKLLGQQPSPFFVGLWKEVGNWRWERFRLS